MLVQSSWTSPPAMVASSHWLGHLSSHTSPTSFAHSKDLLDPTQVHQSLWTFTMTKYFDIIFWRYVFLHYEAIVFYILALFFQHSDPSQI